ncbi:MAG: pyridoxamine 5'-phosphate oxidase family protein [Propionibacteriaceae bacterium]|nr:pyridoxamine 5'-phosphate oxidase family protein [Propionibacteriaceae bacterium]
MTTRAGDGGYFSSLDEAECRKLLASSVVGRVAWETPEGINVLPVNHRVVGDRIVFHTSLNGPLSTLLEPTRVGFQVDEIDAETAVGWTLLVRGTTGPAVGLESVSWVPDGRRVGVAITFEWISGRVVSGFPS